MAIKKLEDELGVALFERNSGEISPTSVGERVIEQAQRVLEQSHAIKEIARQGKDPLQGALRIGVIYPLRPTFCQAWCARCTGAAAAKRQQLLKEMTTGR